MALAGDKRLKLQYEAEHADRIVFDPIKVIREPWLQDLIFQHLSASDVKNLFTVSKTWNQAASESSKAMSKIELHVSESKGQCRTGSFPLKDIGMLLKSNRRYQNVVFYSAYRTNFDQKILILERFSKSLVDLLYVCGTDTENSTFTSGLHFPKLAKLVISTGSEQTIKVLQGATALKEIVLPRSSMSNLMSVGSSLTILEVRVCSKEELEYILTTFPNLREFRLEEDVDFLEISKFNNQSITEFSFGGYKPLPNNFISSMKNLELLYCRISDESRLRKILAEGKRLKRVKICYWDQRENLKPTEVYETVMASDPTIPGNIAFFAKNIR
jgi:hypothetical protein